MTPAPLRRPIPVDIRAAALQLASWTFGSSDDKDVMEVAAALMSAIMAERERCAACCHTALGDGFVMTGPAGIARQIEVAIRKGPCA